jgi:hypothetical protein
MSEKTTGPVVDIEIVAHWEGAAEHAPGVLFEESMGNGMLGGEVALLEFVSWVALAVGSGVIGNSAYEAIKNNVLGVLTAWRRQKGQAKLDDLKEQVFQEMQKHAPNGKLTEQEIKARIDAFFAEIRG